MSFGKKSLNSCKNCKISLPIQKSMNRTISNEKKENFFGFQNQSRIYNFLKYVDLAKEKIYTHYDNPIINRIGINYSVQSLCDVKNTDKREFTCRNSFINPKNKTSCEFSIQNTLNLSKNQKAIDVIENLQKDLIENYQEDISKQVGQWLNSYKRQKDRQMSISFNPHTLQLVDLPQEEQRIPRIIESIKKLMQHVDLLTCPQEELAIQNKNYKKEEKALELIEQEFITIYTQIENAFDEEATIDMSNQNTYVHLKGRRAFNLLHQFSDIFAENEPIYKILPLSKSESFQTLQKLNKYIRMYIIKEEDNINLKRLLHDLNTEKINIYLTLIDRVQSSLDTITKNFKNHSQALEVVLKAMQSSDMIQPFYDAKIDFSSAPEEATTSISMSKNNTFMFQDRNGGKKKSIIVGGITEDLGNEAQRTMEMIEESDEDYDDEDDEEYLNHGKQESVVGTEKNIKKYINGKQKKLSQKNEDMSISQAIDKFTFLIEYLKPGNIPWDLQTIRSEGKIGSGGQGTVFKAFDPKKERQIALKFTNLPYNWENQKESFLQEIRIQSYMTCKNKPRVLEVDNQVYIYQDKYGQQQNYLVSLMELGVGSLEDCFKICVSENKVIDDRHIFHIFFDILQGLDAIHKMDYAHKDIKPQNIIYSIKDKCWKIADFGCIQRIETIQLRNTSSSSSASGNRQSKLDSFKGGISNIPSSGNISLPNNNRFAQECYVTGTPSYMSPELYSLYQQRQEVGMVNLIANDYYSLGITLLKLREMEKIDRSKLNEKIIINKISSDRLSKLITILLNEDQAFRSNLTLNTFTELFAPEYQDYLATQKDDEFNYLENIFKYDENVQDNLNITQKLECAKTYQNINLREKCLKYFEEIANDPEFEKLDLFEKRNIIVEQAQALSYFGDYEKAYEQQMKCLQISSEHLQGFRNNEFIISDIKNVGQILFKLGQYDNALSKYLQVLDIIRDDQGCKQKTDKIPKNIFAPQLRKTLEQAAPQRRSIKKSTGQAVERKSTFHRSKNMQSDILGDNIAVEMCHSDQDSKAGKDLSISDKVVPSKFEEESKYATNLEDLEIKEKKPNLSDSLNNDILSNNKSFMSDFNEQRNYNQGSLRIQQNEFITSNNSLVDLQNDSVLTTSNGKVSESEFQKSSQFDSSVDQHRHFSLQELGTSSSKIKSTQVNIFSSNSQNSRNHSDNLEKFDNIPKDNNKNSQDINEMLQQGGSVNLETIDENPIKRIQQIQQQQLQQQTQDSPTGSMTQGENTNMSFSTSYNKYETHLNTKQDKDNIILQAMEYDNSIGNFNKDGVSQEIQNDLAQIHTLIGQALNKLGHYDKALKYYEEALKTTENNLGKNDISVAIILDSMGESLVSNGRYKESFKIFKRSYKIKRNEYGRNSIHLGETIGSMGRVLEKLTLYEKSGQHYQKALQIFEQHYGQNHIKTAEILNHIGSVKRAEGNYKQAYQAYLEVLAIMSDNYPSDHIELGKIYHDIGNVLRNQDNLELSLEYFLKAEEIKIKYYGSDHVEVSNTWQYIGIIYRKMEKLDLAQQYFELALGPMEKHFGKDHIEVVKLVQEIAVLMQLQGHLQLAQQKLEFVLNNRIKEFGNFHIKTANTMQNMATIEMELGNYSKSLEYNQQVLVVRKQTFGENHIKVANSYTSIAQLYDQMGEYSHALTSLENGINIYMLDAAANKSKILSANIIKASILFNTLHLKDSQNLLEKELIPNIKPSSVNFQQAYTLLSQIYHLEYIILNEEVEDSWLLNYCKYIITDESNRDYKIIFSNLNNTIQNILVESEKTYGLEHISYAHVLEQSGLLNLNKEQAEAALEIKLKRFEEHHKEITNLKETICYIEYLKSKEENIIIQKDSDQYNNLIKRLNTIAHQKQEFYSHNPHHIQLFNTSLLLYRITKDEQYKEKIISILKSDPFTL